MLCNNSYYICYYSPSSPNFNSFKFQFLFVCLLLSLPVFPTSYPKTPAPTHTHTRPNMDPPGGGPSRCRSLEADLTDDPAPLFAVTPSNRPPPSIYDNPQPGPSHRPDNPQPGPSIDLPPQCPKARDNLLLPPPPFPYDLPTSVDDEPLAKALKSIFGEDEIVLPRPGIANPAAPPDLRPTFDNRPPQLTERERQDIFNLFPWLHDVNRFCNRILGSMTPVDSTIIYEAMEFLNR